MPNVDLAIRHPAFVHSRKRRTPSYFSFVSVPPTGTAKYGVLTPAIDHSSTRNFSFVIYVLRVFEARRKAAFEIVEVCWCVAVIPNNCTTINKVRVT